MDGDSPTYGKNQILQEDGIVNIIFTNPLDNKINFGRIRDLEKKALFMTSFH